MSLPSYWMATTTLPRLPKLEENIKVDVAIVGGGLTGLTTAYLLKKAGRTVAVLERDRCAQADTGHTTAHLTHVTDARLHELVDRFGRDHARAVWDAGRAAIEQIHTIVHEEKIECDFKWVPGFLHAPWKSEQPDDKLGKDASLASELGFEAKLVDSVPLLGQPGIRFPQQAKFHPQKYILGLLNKIPGDGCYVFEQSEVEEFQDSPLSLKANGYTITCDRIMIATHVPLMGNKGLLGATLFQSKISPYTSYTIGAQLPKGTAPEALFWDTSDPYRYLRIDSHAQFDYVIYGGEDHKTGQAARPEESFLRLEKDLIEILPEAKVDQRWSGQVIVSVDGLPYIGETADRQFAATAFCGNGITFGTVAGLMMTDAVCGRKSPWKALFDPSRKKLSAVWDYLKENIDYPYYMVRDRLARAEGDSVDGLKPGEGKILKLGGERVAAFRSPAGKVTTLSPTCTHMGCFVRWNTADSTWDCPCHGSRFHPTGDVLAGPAEAPLAKAETQENS